MCLSRFTKFQYCFYTGLSKFFSFMFLFYRKASARILLKKRNGFIISGIWMTMIFVPCGIKCLSLPRLQEVSKIQNSSPMFRERIFQKSCKINLHRMFSRIQGQKLVFERKPLPKPRTKQSSDNCTTDANHCYFIGTRFHFYSYAVVGILIGLVISYGLIRFIFWMALLRQ